MLNVLVWATTFGADLWSLTKYLDAREDVRVRVLLKGLDAYRRQPIARLMPLSAPMRERRPWHHVVGWPGFVPDVTVMDNWIPKRAPSPNGFVLWHGFGWKGPNDREEFAPLHRNLARCWGDPTAPNDHFRWQCFGPSDFQHRTQTSGFHPDNCRILGAASHDDLRVPLARDRVADDYPLDIVGRKNVLIAPTWHYGEVFAHWGRDADLFERLVARIGQIGANAIIRLHDSYRFEPAYRQFLSELDVRHDHVQLKFKDQAPDNYVDLQIADVLITNFSSIANLFYATRRPTIHVYPVASADEAFMWRTFDDGQLVQREIESVRYIWKFPPEQNGGLLARDFDTLLQQVELALAEPDCCRDVCEAFLAEHMLGADGQNCRRIHDGLVELVED